MEKITFHFHANDSFFSRLIRWKTGSHISHVSIEVRGWHYNAYAQKRFYRTTEIGPKVKESYSIVVDRITAENAMAILESYLNTVYDYKSIFGFLINKNSQSRRKIYCSEIANHILELVIPGDVKMRKLISPEYIRIAVIYFLKGIEYQNMY